MGVNGSRNDCLPVRFRRGVVVVVLVVVIICWILSTCFFRRAIRRVCRRIILGKSWQRISYLFIYFIKFLFTPFSRFTILLFFGTHPFPASPAPRKAEALFLLEGCFFVPPAMKVWLCWLVRWSVCKACLPMSCVCHGTIGGATDVATRMSPFPQLPFYSAV